MLLFILLACRLVFSILITKNYLIKICCLVRGKIGIMFENFDKLLHFEIVFVNSRILIQLAEQGKGTQCFSANITDDYVYSKTFPHFTLCKTSYISPCNINTTLSFAFRCKQFLQGLAYKRGSRFCSISTPLRKCNGNY